MQRGCPACIAGMFDEDRHPQIFLSDTICSLLNNICNYFVSIFTDFDILMTSIKWIETIV